MEEVQQEIKEEKQDTMQLLLEKTRKQLFYTRILALASVGIFLVVFVAAFVVIPKVNSVLRQADEVMTDAQGILQNADEAISNISAMSSEVTEVSHGLNVFITQNAETLTDAAKDISEIDFEGLNTAIRDLQDAVGPFAKMINRFK